MGNGVGVLVWFCGFFFPPPGLARVGMLHSPTDFIFQQCTKQIWNSKSDLLFTSTTPLQV